MAREIRLLTMTHTKKFSTEKIPTRIRIGKIGSVDRDDVATGNAQGIDGRGILLGLSSGDEATS